MCRNYDGGECVEPDCSGRITCHDFMDKRCAEHSINGRGGLPFVDDDTPAPEQDRPDAADLWRAINGALLASPVHINREDAALATRWVVDVIAPFVVTRSQTDKRPHPDVMGTTAHSAELANGSTCGFCGKPADVWPSKDCEEPQEHTTAVYDCDCGDVVTIADAIASPKQHRRCRLIGAGE